MLNWLRTLSTFSKPSCLDLLTQRKIPAAAAAAAPAPAAMVVVSTPSSSSSDSSAAPDGISLLSTLLESS